VRIGIPPAASICIISEVPERGSPETIVIIFDRAGGELTEKVSLCLFLRRVNP
jgi:hypothetical protein